MSTQPYPPTRLASEDVIINAPMSYAGSAQRIMRLRRKADAGWALVALTVLALLLIVMAWSFVTAWYLVWGLWLVPYRVLRRGARKRKVEAMRHRELMGTIQGSSAASAAAIVAATTPQLLAASAAPSPPAPHERVGDVDREGLIDELRRHMLAGRLNAQDFEQRLEAAHRAVTRHDIDVLGHDLPVQAADQPASEPGPEAGLGFPLQGA